MWWHSITVNVDVIQMRMIIGCDEIALQRSEATQCMTSTIIEESNNISSDVPLVEETTNVAIS